MRRIKWQYLAGFLGGFSLSGLLAAPAPAVPQQLAASPPRLAQSYTATITNTLYRHYTLKYPAPVLTSGISFPQAGRMQAEFIGRLRAELGPIVGFKAALTSSAVQERFGVNHPLYGFLLESMLLESGDSLPLRFGARPMAEGDLMVRVGSGAINTATSDQELLASLDALIPFLELPDLMYEADATVDATALVAINVGARYGVMGEPIPLTADEDWITRLGNIRVQLSNDTGRTVASGDASALLGHPIQALRWLRDTLIAQGIELRPGDVLSLGSMTPLVPVEPGQMRLRYFGLDPNQRPGNSVDVWVRFHGDN